MTPRFGLTLLMTLALAACGGDAHDHEDEGDAGHPEKGPHGGQLIEVGEERGSSEVSVQIAGSCERKAKGSLLRCSPAQHRNASFLS